MPAQWGALQIITLGDVFEEQPIKLDCFAVLRGHQYCVTSPRNDLLRFSPRSDRMPPSGAEGGMNVHALPGNMSSIVHPWVHSAHANP
jgi:hypothetical protein